MTREAPIKSLILAELPEVTLDSPKYAEAQNQLAKEEGVIKTEKGWWELPSGKLLVLEKLAPTLVSQTHQATHLLLLLLLSHFSRVRLCATPETAAHQAPLSLGFSRQEHWSGLPPPSPVHESEKRK